VNIRQEVIKYVDSKERESLYSIKLVSSTQQQLLQAFKNYFSQRQGSSRFSGPYANSEHLIVGSTKNLPIPFKVILSTIEEIKTNTNDPHTKVIAERVYRNDGSSYQKIARDLKIQISEANINSNYYKETFFDQMIQTLSGKGIVEVK
jgi:hypothetical protein